MRAAGNLVGRLLVELSKRVKPGVSTKALDDFSRDFIESQGATPAFLGYHGYPASICASVNEQVVHGIPSVRPLAEGDIVGIDVGAVLNGFVGDAARTFAVGKVSEEAARLAAVDVLSDGWTVMTRDRRLSAHFEDTVIVTAGEPEIITRLD